jgi:hypothetical protein
MEAERCLRKSYNRVMKEFEEDEEAFTPYNELWKFCEEYSLLIELDKPFPEFDNIILRVVDPDGEILKKIILDNITELQPQSGKVLNDLAKESEAWL